jgi:trehalose 6-phosphate phosphatase
MNESSLATDIALPRSCDGWALFLDVDGTLLEIAERPDAVRAGRRTIDILAALDGCLEHALALVSGRPINVLDRLFAPLRLASAGLHGLERRTPAGMFERASAPAPMLDEVRTAFAAFAARHPGVLVEDKELTVALHFRGAPGCAAEARAAAATLARRFDEALVLQEGKMVVELRPRGPDKGDVVEMFMRSPPFSGRRPLFVGDDVTDEAGFAAANRLGGLSIRIGDGSRSAARLRLADVAALLDWLARLAAGHRNIPGDETS